MPPPLIAVGRIRGFGRDVSRQLKENGNGVESFEGINDEVWMRWAHWCRGSGVEPVGRHRRAPCNVGRKGDGPKQVAAGPIPQWAITFWCSSHAILAEKQRDVCIDRQISGHAVTGVSSPPTSF